MYNTVFIRSNPVSPDSRVEKEVKSLRENNIKPIVLAWDREANYNEKAFILRDDIPIIRRGFKASFGEGFKNIIPFLKFQLFIFKWLIKNRNEYDIIHACDFDTAFTASCANFFLKKKFIFDIFDYLSTNPNGLFKKIIKKLEDGIINNADATIICTEDRLNQIKDSKPNKVVVIHNTPESVNYCFKKPQQKIKIVYVGILQDYRLLKEMSNVIRNRRDCELHIAGFGIYSNYFDELSQKNDNIHFYGKISYDETIKLESNCDIMLALYDPKIGNHIYAAPNKFYESLMLGKPVIMVRGTGMSSIVDKYKIGECIDYTEKGFEIGLSNLINRKNEWKDISIRMRNLYNTTYSWDKMESRLIDLYNDF